MLEISELERKSCRKSRKRLASFWSKPWSKAVCGIALAIICWSQARADDPRCLAPPYGATEASFRAFVKNFGHLVVPTQMLPAICKAKYGGADRTALYNLGFTDQDIDSKELGELAVQVILALHDLASKVQ